MPRKAKTTPQDPMSVAELSARWRANPKTVWRLVAQGKLPGAFRVGRQWRVPLADVEAYEAKTKGGK